MKRWIILASITAMAAAVLFIWQVGGSFAASSTPAVLAVDEFMKNVDRYRGQVKVSGVVSAVSPEQQSLTLIDSGEFQECGVTTCAQLKLPVRWTGPMPQVRDLIRVDGEVQTMDGRLIFVARTLEKVPPQSKGSK